MHDTVIYAVCRSEQESELHLRPLQGYLPDQGLEQKSTIKRKVGYQETFGWRECLIRFLKRRSELVA